MSPAVLLTEIGLLTCLICGVHSLKRWMGLVPLYVLVGLFEAFLFFSGKAADPISAPLFFGETANVSYMLFLPGILTILILVYVLEGTAEARRLILAVGILYIVHGVIDVVIEFHGYRTLSAELPALDLLYYSTRSRIASVVAIGMDFVILVVGYQFFRNRMPRLPLAVPLFLALMAAFLTDAVVYQLIRHGAMQWDRIYMVDKLQAGVACGIPASLYLVFRLRRHSGDVRRGMLERGALELVDLRRKVSEMQRKLKEQQAQYIYIKDTFSRYVSPDVVETIISDPTKLKLGGEVRDVSILFADIRSYSTLSESLAPTEIIDLLNRYFRAVTRVILDRKGMINEFEGDAVLAVFGAPLDVPNHADQAVRAGLGMLDAVDELNEEWVRDGTMSKWKSAGIDGLAIRVGVHSGPVVAGNVGSEARTKYAVIGDTVNTASRVEGLNKQLRTSFLATAATIEALADADLKARAVDLGTHVVKGRVEPVGVFAFEAAAGDKPAADPSQLPPAPA